MLFRPSLLAVLLLAGSAVARAGEVDYLRDVKPIFAHHCVACHGGLKAEAGLRLDTGEAIRKGGKRGAVVAPGASATSELIRRVTSPDEHERMPQEGAPLEPAKIEVLRAWIDAGAPHPPEAPPPDPLKHWSFVPPVRPDIPPAATAGALAGSDHPVDRFLAADHARLQLTPVDMADRHTLLRRVTIDLTGLPPTREEIDAFVNDPAPDAYEKVVDGLLASPAYAQRWARHWMDVWRYSDFDGFNDQVRESQPHIWRWRDWIVESLAADKPYDRMVAEMLAGDELAPTDADTLRATGFLARNYNRFNRNTWLDNTVEHTAKAFLGLTVNCARCHDHKYDPISQAEYYRVRAVFEPHDVRIDPAPDGSAAGVVRVFDAKPNAPTYLFVRGNEKEPDTENPLDAAAPRVAGAAGLDIAPVALPTFAAYPGLRPEAQRAAEAAAEKELNDAKAKLGEARQGVARAEAAAPAVAAALEPGTLEQTDPAAPELAGDPLIATAFAAPEAGRAWKLGRGQWKFTEEGLRQSDGAAEFCQVRSVAAHPGDFVARFRFRIEGGEGFRSVGLSFDVGEKDAFGAAYVTAHNGATGAQIFYRERAADVYPPETFRPLPVALEQPHELTVAVRGQLVNIWVDGTFAGAYTLPHERQPGGRIALWTLDAVTLFEGFDLWILPADAALAAIPTAPPPAADQPDAKASPAAAPADVEAAELAVEAAEAKLVFTRARTVADRLRYAEPAASPDMLARATADAVRAERHWAELDARQALLAARRAVDAAKGNDDAALRARLKEAEDKLAAAKDAAASEPTGDYTPLGPKYPASSTGRRSALARRIVDPSNPLTARVAVNHIWMRHVNAPLVRTVFDFGHNGKPPVNPALLDWLAVEFMENGWRTKPLHRLVVTSRAYRLQSKAAGDLAARNRELDPDNLHLWRMNPRRLEAEAIRDGVLLLAGRLDRTTGGPDLDPNTDETVPRRSIYFRHSKEKRSTFLTVFDQANVVECYRRDESILPQQALAMANSELVSTAAAAIAKRIEESAGTAEEAFVREAFVTVLGRPASEAEVDVCRRYLARGIRRDRLVHSLLNHNDFVTAR